MTLAGSASRDIDDADMMPTITLDANVSDTLRERREQDMIHTVAVIQSRRGRRRALLYCGVGAYEGSGRFRYDTSNCSCSCSRSFGALLRRWKVSDRDSPADASRIEISTVHDEIFATEVNERGCASLRVLLHAPRARGHRYLPARICRCWHTRGTSGLPSATSHRVSGLSFHLCSTVHMSFVSEGELLS